MLAKIPIKGHSETTHETVFLEGDLRIPQNSAGLVVFVHGSGSGRLSPRNQSVAERLNKDGLATLLFDLLTMSEEKIDNQTRRLRFDINLLSMRLISTLDWIINNLDTQNLNVGLFGASTGAAAALVAAAERPAIVKGIVSRGGRPDLARKKILTKVTASTLLVVGGNDEQVLELNEEALKHIKTEKKKLTVIPGASHLFEEPGKLEEVARLASGWFRCFFFGLRNIALRERRKIMHN
jgi:putative phosphoribosyl transferase